MHLIVDLMRLELILVNDGASFEFGDCVWSVDIFLKVDNLSLLFKDLAYIPFELL